MKICFKALQVSLFFCLIVLSSCLNGDKGILFTQPIIKPTGDISFEGSVIDTGDSFVSESIDYLADVTVSGGSAISGITAEFSGSSYLDFKDGSFPGTGGSCQTTMEAQTCTIALTYSPQDFAIHTTTLTFSFYNGKQQISRSVEVKGETLAILDIDEAPTFDFGNITLGTSADKVFTITHRGINPATSISAVSLSSICLYRWQLCWNRRNLWSRHDPWRYLHDCRSIYSNRSS